MKLVCLHRVFGPDLMKLFDTKIIQRRKHGHEVIELDRSHLTCDDDERSKGSERGKSLVRVFLPTIFPGVFCALGIRPTRVYS